MLKGTKLLITPDTRVGDMLETYPELEGVLISLSSSFSKLRNPVLRKSVARVVTLRQIAKVGNVSLAALMKELRKATGQDMKLPSEKEQNTETTRPSWVKESAVVESFDARPIIDAGRNPMKKVFQKLNKMGAGQLFELTTPFVPEPLIDIAVSKGFEVWSEEKEAELVKTCFMRK